MTLFKWSRTASADATADSTINWAEGQSPSSVNDSARAMMAATAKFRDDIAGAIVTGGTSTAYTVTSYQGFDTLAHLDGQIIAFTPHVTNGATVTLNVDSLGAKPLRTAPSVELQSNVLILGTPYLAIYNNTDAVFYLHNLASNTYGVPLGAGMDYWLPTSPSSAFVFPIGQAISRITYATLFSAMGTTYGTGDGSTTFNLPDKTGRVSAMKEAAASRLTTAGSSVDGATLGAAGGLENHTLTTAQMPSHFHSAGISDPGHSHVVSGGTIGGTSTTTFGSGSFSAAVFSPSTIGINPALTGVRVNSTTNGIDTTYSTGGGGAHNNVQPTIVCNYILRII